MSNPEFMQEWFEEEATPESVDLKLFDQRVDEFLAEKEKAEALDAELTKQNKKVMAMSTKIMEYLDMLGKKKHHTSKGSIVKVERTEWKAPEGEDRLAVVEMLKERGEYDSIAAFNAKKFNTWYCAELEANPDFKLKGVEQHKTSWLKRGK